MVYRYYVGLQLPIEIWERICRAQTILFDSGTVIQPLEPHITLLPPPALEHSAPEELIPLLKTAAAQLWPLSLSLTSVEAFGNQSVVVRVDSSELHTLHRKLVALIPDSPSLRQPFHPHLTLAQAVRGKQLPDRLSDEYRNLLKASLPYSFEVSHLTLFRWQGPREYTAQQL